MLNDVISVLIAFACISSAMLAGIYFIFSNTIMPSLKAMASGPETMQLINRCIQNSGFFILFFGSFISCIALLILTLQHDTSISPAKVVGALLLISTFISTVLINVPLNNQLDNQVAGSQEMRTVWAIYLTRWLKWNHLRAVLCLLSALCFLW